MLENIANFVEVHASNLGLSENFISTYFLAESNNGADIAYMKWYGLQNALFTKEVSWTHIFCISDKSVNLTTAKVSKNNLNKGRFGHDCP